MNGTSILEISRQDLQAIKKGEKRQIVLPNGTNLVIQRGGETHYLE